MSKLLQEKNYYKDSAQVLPVKWSAPEVATVKRFIICSSVGCMVHSLLLQMSGRLEYACGSSLPLAEYHSQKCPTLKLSIKLPTDID